MKRLRSIGVLVSLSAATVAFGQPTAATFTTTGFDCWIGSNGPSLQTRFIRCMTDRDLPHAELSNTQTEEAMHLLHQEFHGKSGAAAEIMFKANLELIRMSPSVWNIRIFSYPSDWSWQEGTPERLVRAVLCPSEGNCTVMIRKD
ncbi:MAG: hypothetical protein M0Z99_27960 [Betaproteobacteria bacterium]|nr:hypothetical protein [Betaproteobacteria bacterium]